MTCRFIIANSVNFTIKYCFYHLYIGVNATSYISTQVYRLIDTAGIRRRAAVAASGSKTEELSVNRAFRAIRRADVVALVIDAMACVTEQVHAVFYSLLV